MMLVITFLIFAAVIGTACFNLRKGIKLFILLFPFLQPYILLDLGVLRYPVQSLLTVTLFIFIVIKTLNDKNKSSELKKIYYSKTIIYFMLILLIPTILNLEIVGANIIGLIFLFLQKLSIAYIGWIAFNSVREGNKLVSRLLTIFFCLAIYGLFENILRTNPFLNIFANNSSSAIASDNVIRYTLDDQRGYRIQTVFYHAYSWGGCLLILSSTYLYLVFNNRGKSSFYKYGFVFLLIFLNVFFTRSRACFLPSLLMIISILFLTPNRGRVRTFIAALLFSAVISVALSSELLESLPKYFTFSSEGSVRGSSSEMRLGQMLSAFSMIQDKPILGNGFGATRKLLQNAGRDTELEGAESIWFIVLIDSGIAGVIAYIVFFTSLIRRLRRLKKQVVSADLKLRLKVAVITVISYIFFISLTGEMNTFPFFMLYLGMFGKLIYLQNQQETKELLLDEYPSSDKQATDWVAA